MPKYYEYKIAGYYLNTAMKAAMERIIKMSAKEILDNSKDSQRDENVLAVFDLLSDDFMEDGRDQLECQKREEL